MRRLPASSALLWFAAALLLGAQSPDREPLHKAAHSTEQATVLNDAHCTATAIAPHALLTASHCELGTDTLKLDDEKELTIEGRLRDGEDHTIYLVKGVTFKNTVPVCIRKLHQGEHIFMWGNPGREDDMYREGYIEGRFIYPADDGIFHEEFMLDLNIDHGDSGAAIFDVEGNLVAVLSTLSHEGGTTKKDAGVFPLAFTAEQLDKAKEF